MSDSSREQPPYGPYARVIIDEAIRRGYAVTPLDPREGCFLLNHEGRSVRCCESLSERTSAVAYLICDDKSFATRVARGAGVVTPDEAEYTTDEEAARFLARHGAIVAKPMRGSQGKGISVGVDAPEGLSHALAYARQFAERVLLQEYIDGEDLRLIVIGGALVAAARRVPPTVVGDGASSIGDLIARLSRRRQEETGGESHIPLDAETERCVRKAGYALADTLPPGRSLRVRLAANLHTGGTIHDVTDAVHPALVEAALAVARAIDIPVVGIDLIVEATDRPRYHFLEANAQPGLANHEPQPTVERFLDLLFS